ncbi:MAG: hypothetical protein IPK82_10675 [Polyangiaceae bacterium]|nr:hypothetical protein [Polyangiaceae bacterium]
MVNLLPALGLGFVVGLRHALEADHVAAVGAIVARERNVRGAALIGATWGVGHAAALMILGGAIVAAGLVVPKRIALTLELGVGVMLVALGVWNFFSREKQVHKTHRHDLENGERSLRNVYTLVERGGEPAMLKASRKYTSPAPGNEYTPSASSDVRAPVPEKSPLRRLLRPFLVGSMHGLAGSAAAALLVVAVAQTALSAFVYLACFGVGTTMGMVVVTGALAVPMARAFRRFHAAETWVRLGAGALSFVVGAVVVYQIGFRDGLFFQ